MSSLGLAVVFVVWLGIAGPINLFKTLEALQPWQTLIAAFVALGAATLAYRGAMAKVELDREEAERKRANERRGLYLRLRSRLKTLEGFTADVQSQIRRRSSESGSPIPVSYSLMTIPEVEELEEVWKNLHLFPNSAFPIIDDLRVILPRARRSLASVKEKDDEAPMQILDAIWRGYFEGDCRRIQDESQALIQIIDDVITRLQSFE